MWTHRTGRLPTVTSAWNSPRPSALVLPYSSVAPHGFSAMRRFLFGRYSDVEGGLSDFKGAQDLEKNQSVT